MTISSGPGLSLSFEEIHSLISLRSEVDFDDNQGFFQGGDQLSFLGIRQSIMVGEFMDGKAQAVKFNIIFILLSCLGLPGRGVAAT
jgi:hypothetical protein